MLDSRPFRQDLTKFTTDFKNDMSDSVLTASQPNIQSMKLYSVFTAFVLILFLTVTGCEQPEKLMSEPTKKAVFIIVDGIAADILEEVDTPSIDQVIAQGAYTRGWLGGEAGGYSESPTVSAVGYNHVITGVWSNKHNVFNNDIEDPNYNYWNIFRLFKENDPEKPVAIYSSWLDNRTKLVGDGLSEAGNLQIDIHYDGFDTDTLAFPHEEGYVQRIDEHVSLKAAESILQDAPHLSWVYLWYTDDTGHQYGEVDKHFESIKVADQQVGRIWEAVQQRMEEYDEDWLVVITTDHGRRLPDGKGHGGHSERERTIWVATNKHEMNAYFENTEPAITDIYPTIARHLDLRLPEQLEKELDGVPLTGDVSVSHPSAEFDAENGTITVNWKA